MVTELERFWMKLKEAKKVPTIGQSFFDSLSGQQFNKAYMQNDQP